MSKSTMITIGVLGTIGLVVLIAIFSLMGSYNTMVRMENSIKAQYSQNQNNYDNMWKKFKEAVQVTDMYAADLKKVFDSSIQARYGSEGSKAMFQFLKEHNPNFDSKMYQNIQQMIESGRASFAAEQKMLIDKKQVYQNYFETAPNNIVAGMFGFPRIDLTKYDIVTSGTTQDAFDSKKADEIKLRQ